MVVFRMVVVVNWPEARGRLPKRAARRAKRWAGWRRPAEFATREVAVVVELCVVVLVIGTMIMVEVDRPDWGGCGLGAVVTTTGVLGGAFTEALGAAVEGVEERDGEVYVIVLFELELDVDTLATEVLFKIELPEALTAVLPCTITFVALPYGPEGGVIGLGVDDVNVAEKAALAWIVVVRVMVLDVTSKSAPPLLVLVRGGLLLLSEVL
jgi:hypothetical protein